MSLLFFITSKLGKKSSFIIPIYTLFNKLFSILILDFGVTEIPGTPYIYISYCILTLEYTSQDGLLLPVEIVLMLLAHSADLDDLILVMFFAPFRHFLVFRYLHVQLHHDVLLALIGMSC